MSVEQETTPLDRVRRLVGTAIIVAALLGAAHAVWVGVHHWITLNTLSLTTTAMKSVQVAHSLCWFATCVCMVLIGYAILCRKRGIGFIAAGLFLVFGVTTGAMAGLAAQQRAEYNTRLDEIGRALNAYDRKTEQRGIE